MKTSKTPFPADIMPMLATLADKPFDDDGWLYEVKWDGYRALAYINKGNVEIRSRNNKSFNEKFYPVYQALKKWKANVVADGEIVVVNEKGLPDFGALQNWRSEADGNLAFYLFDLLWLDGQDVMEQPLTVRRQLLRSVVPVEDDVIKLSENFEATGSEFFALADKMGLEGIMAKRATGIYTPGSRTKDWLKIKTEKHQEAIIAGFTRNENSTKLFSALSLGLYEGEELVFIGPVGTGFTHQQQKELLQKMRPLETATCPFKIVPDYNKPSRFRPNPPKATVTWLKPSLVCEISYRELTKDKALRHPSFRGLRADKNAKEVTWEMGIKSQDANMQNEGEQQHGTTTSKFNTASKIKRAPSTKNKEPKVLSGKSGAEILQENKIIVASKEHERKTLLNPKDESQVRNINGHDIKFNNLSKVYWPNDKVTKRDMFNYYYQVAPYILPYVKDKPQTLYRFPNGITGEPFYQKDVKGKVPAWVRTFPYTDSEGVEKEFLVVDSEADILYIASLGCIEINPWNSRIQTPDNPDWCIIDLDPDKNTFNQVIEAANVTRQIFETIGVPSYPKTSGSTGLHIYVPFGAKYSYEDCKEFGRTIAKLVHQQLPSFTSIQRKISDRGGKMYIDFLQNRPKATVAGPYSLRPKPGATVSMPLFWEEVKKGLKMKDFTIRNAVSRVKEVGDIFKPVMSKGIDLAKALKKVTKEFGNLP